MYRAAAAAAAALSRSSSSVVRRELARGGVYGGAEQYRWARRFAAKEVSFGLDARAAIMRGVNDPAPADAVKGKGTYVMLTVAKSTELDDSAEKVGASLVHLDSAECGTTRGSVTMEGLKAAGIPHLKCKAWVMDSTYQTNQNYGPLLIFAEDADGEALSMINKPHAGLKICTFKALGFGENRRGDLNDMAVSMGGQLVRRFEHRRLFTTTTKVTDLHKENNDDDKHKKGKQDEFTFFEMLKLAIKSLLSKAKSMVDGKDTFTELQTFFIFMVSVLSAIQYGCFRVLAVADAHHDKKVEDRFAAEEKKLEAWLLERELVLVNQKRDEALFAAAEAEIRCEESSRHAENLVKNLALLGRDIFYLSGEIMEVKWFLTAVGGGPKEE